jgi:hypothetical protein
MSTVPGGGRSQQASGPLQSRRWQSCLFSAAITKCKTGFIWLTVLQARKIEGLHLLRAFLLCHPMVEGRRAREHHVQKKGIGWHSSFYQEPPLSTASPFLQ